MIISGEDIHPSVIVKVNNVEQNDIIEIDLLACTLTKVSTGSTFKQSHDPIVLKGAISLEIPNIHVATR